MQEGAGTQGDEAEDAFDCLNEGVRLELWMIMKLKATALERASLRAGELKGRGLEARMLAAMEVLVRVTTFNHRLVKSMNYRPYIKVTPIRVFVYWANNINNAWICYF